MLHACIQFVFIFKRRFIIRARLWKRGRETEDTEVKFYPFNGAGLPLPLSPSPPRASMCINRFDHRALLSDNRYSYRQFSKIPIVITIIIITSFIIITLLLLLLLILLLSLTLLLIICLALINIIY